MGLADSCHAHDCGTTVFTAPQISSNHQHLDLALRCKRENAAIIGQIVHQIKRFVRALRVLKDLLQTLRTLPYGLH